MILQADQVTTEAARVLKDAGFKYWTEQELLDYLNAGRNVLYLAVPRLYETTQTITLVEGARQTVPGGSRRLFGLIENVSADSKRVITPINRELLTRLRPGWRSSDASDEILHFSYVETEAGSFEVFPPAISGTQVKASYAAPPARLVLATGHVPNTVLTPEGELSTALVHYVLHRAFAKASTNSPDAGQRSAAELALFMQMIGAEDASKRDSSPNTTAVAGKPTGATNR